MIERISEFKGAYCIIPDGAFYAMLYVKDFYGKKFDDRVITDSASFADVLLDAAKVAVIPGAAFGADECVRLSYSLSMEEMLEGLDRIDAFLMSLE